MDKDRKLAYKYFNLPFYKRINIAKRLKVFNQEDLNVKSIEATQKWCKAIIRKLKQIINN